MKITKEQIDNAVEAYNNNRELDALSTEEKLQGDEELATKAFLVYAFVSSNP